MGEVDAEDGQVVVEDGGVVGVPRLEAGVLGGAGRQPGGQRADGVVEPAEGAPVLDEGAGAEAGQPGEELQDVQGRGVQQDAVQLGAVAGQAAGGVGGGAAQLPDERVRLQPGVLHDLQVDVAEGAERTGEGVRHGPVLLGGDGPLPCRAGGAGQRGHGPVDELGGDAPYVALCEGAFLAAEGDQAADP